MCGRYTNTARDPQVIAQRFEITISPAVAERALGRANIAPTQSCWRSCDGEDGEPGGGPRPVRVGPGVGEAARRTVADQRPRRQARSSGAWKRLAASAGHRALIVADGYYEWQKPEDPKQPKQPFYHRLSDGEPFAFAGLWTTATPKDAEEPITSCSIITTAANAEVRVVHDRMPVILDGPDAEAAWLISRRGPGRAHGSWSGRSLTGGLRSIAVSPRVNNARNQGVELTEPLQG